MSVARAIFLALLSLSMLPAAPALANDSSAALESGELQLTPNRDVALEREDLFLSTSEIRVSYRFRNTSDKDVVTLVAFPMPPINVAADYDYGIAPDAKDDFIDFRVVVNGKETAPQVQLRAIRFGVDQTAILEKHKIPVLPFGEPFYESFKALSDDARAELERAGLVDWSTFKGPNDSPAPNAHWEAHATYYWEQTFPAGQVTEISHSYKPVPAVSFYGSYTLEDTEQTSSYCLGDDPKGVKAFFDKRPEGIQKELFYILTTANNWQGEIREFNLTIDKGKPENLVSLCFDGIEKTGPTTFTASLKDFVPEQDLQVLFLVPHEKK